MLASRRNCARRSGSGTSAAKPLHSAAKRINISVYFLTLNSDMVLFFKGGSACISQSSAGQRTVPVMALRWGRVVYLASVIFPISEHVHDITDLPKSKAEGSALLIQRSGLRYGRPIDIRATGPPHWQTLNEAICRWRFSMRRLLGSLPYLMDLDTRHRSRGAVLQVVRREKGDSSFLIGSDLVRECAGLDIKGSQPSP
jgi:hypothetical protein